MKQVAKIFRSPSLAISLLLSIAIVFFRFVYPPLNILSWDVFGYYLYLPAQFIYHDLKLTDLSWVNALVDKYHTTETLYQLYQVDGGHWVIKESIGLAVLNAPAFFLAHFFASISGYATDGFSLPYQYGFAISGLIYACIGIFMLRKILREYFDEKVTAILLLLIVAGTNHFQLTAFDGMLSHNYTFTLYTFIVWFTIRWHKEQKFSQAAWLGLSMGLAVLCRPSELVCILIPLLWGIHNRQSLADKWKLVAGHWKHLVVLIMMTFLGGLPQLLYWKLVTGHWLYYTYQNPGEGLDLLAPYTMKFLFSFRKGWLIYTPLMLFALAGLYNLYLRQKPVFLAIFIYFIFNLWIISSWTAWWYGGGSYSQRAMLPSYVLMALPLGYYLKNLSKKGRLIRSVSAIIITALLLLNIFQTWQWAHGMIDKTRMTRAYYMAIFGKTTVDPEDRKLLLIDKLAEEKIPADKTGLHYKLLARHDFEAANGNDQTLSDTSCSGSHSLKVMPTSPFVAGYESGYEDLTAREYAWIRISAWVYPLMDIENSAASLVASFEHEGGVYKYQAESILKKQFSVTPGKWTLVSFDYLTPDIRSVKDRLKVYFWLQGNEPVLIDDLKVEMWEPLED